MKWNRIEFETVFPVVRNGVSIKQESGRGGIPITRIETIADGSINPNKFGYADVIDERYQSYYLQKGDILMSHINSWDHLGKCALVRDVGQKVIHGMNLLLLRPDCGRLLPAFASYYFKTKSFRANLDRISNQSVNQSSFSVSKLKKLTIPIPPLHIQQQISDTLDKADALRRKDQELLQKYDDLAQSIFYDIFGDPVRNEKGWNYEMLGNLLTNIEAGTSMGGEDRELVAGEIGVLKVSAVTSGAFKPDEYKVPSQNLLPNKVVTIKEGDLLFSRANTRELVGAVAIAEKTYSNLMLPDKLWRLDLNTEVFNRYYARFLLWNKDIRHNLTKTATGTSGSMLNISMAKLRDLKVPVPPIDLQREFERIYRSIHLQSLNAKDSHDGSGKLFDKLLQTYFQ